MTSPFRSIVFDEIGSTNREALQRAEAGERGPVWIVARRQTAGRGRSGRQWSSEPGNLYASLLVELACPPALVPQLSLLAGVAVVDAIRTAAGKPLPGLRLKWPNDVLIGQAKCVGILAESISGQHSTIAVVGIGINVAWHPADVGRAATSLAEHGVQIAPDELLKFVAAAIEEWLAVWQCGAGFGEVRAAWLDRAGRPGEKCSVHKGTEQLEGTFVGLDPSGALLMQDREGGVHTISFGDVRLAQGAPGGTG